MSTSKQRRMCIVTKLRPCVKRMRLWFIASSTLCVCVQASTPVHSDARPNFSFETLSESFKPVAQFVQGIAKHNHTALSGVAVAAGLTAIKRSLSTQNLGEKFGELADSKLPDFAKWFKDDGPGAWGLQSANSDFRAVVQDGSRVPTSLPKEQADTSSGSRRELASSRHELPEASTTLDPVQWLPPEWQIWGQKVEAEMKQKLQVQILTQKLEGLPTLQHMGPEFPLHLRVQRDFERDLSKTKDELTQTYEHMSRKLRAELSRIPTWDAINQELTSNLENGGILKGIRQPFKGLTQAISNKIDALRSRLNLAPKKDGVMKARDAKNMAAQVAQTNKMLVGRLFTVLGGDGWEHVLQKDGVDVYRKKMVGEAGDKFYCIKAVGTIEAPPQSIYNLLKDNSRVSEYNDECKDVRELDTLDENTKVTWASSKTYFPFKPRDFVTRCHNTQLQDGTYVVLTRSEDIQFEGAKAYGDPNKTEFTTIAHINPGGAADTPLGAQITNRICTYGPVSFICKLEQVCGQQTLV